MKRLSLLLAAVILVACAHSSGVLKMGPDTYSVSASASAIRGGRSGAKNIAVTEANEKCAFEGKEILITNTSYSGETVDITFQCLAKDDPALHRPMYHAAPTTVIEDRRN
jgi:hypothetical protein